eukprot:TRINITY_DN1006_c1_g1_i3.p1 TRINITY_DN1006_c1_g1~~TRINITY_DN1006_c1_g1_i3.p1  ORF type:complete len:183 (+),score=26.59 TRINITY_DN1006_c1_g1_i3:100-648(+)
MSNNRKHVIQSLTDFVEIKHGQCIAKVLASRGHNILEVITDKGDQILCTIPAKYIKKVWFKRGMFALVEPAREQTISNKVKAVIVCALFPEQIDQLIEDGYWPDYFKDDIKQKKNISWEDIYNFSDEEEENEEEEEIHSNSNNLNYNSEEEEEEEEFLEFVTRNPNHRVINFDDSDSEDEYL